MGGSPANKYKVALDALSAVEEYASVFGIETYQDLEVFSKAEETLDQVPFPREVREKVKSVAHTILQKNVSTVKLLKEENRRKVELLEEENKRKAELLETVNKKKSARFWRSVKVAFVVTLYLLCALAVYFDKDWRLIATCVPVVFVDYLMMRDNTILRFLAKIGSKFSFGSK